MPELSPPALGPRHTVRANTGWKPGDPLKYRAQPSVRASTVTLQGNQSHGARACAEASAPFSFFFSLFCGGKENVDQDDDLQE